MTQTMRERLIAAAVNAPRAVGHEAHMKAVVDAILADLRVLDDKTIKAMRDAFLWPSPMYDQSAEIATTAFTAMIDHVRAG